MEWAYSVTSVPERLDNLLLRTLASLAAGGFEHPHLFIDGIVEADLPACLDAYEVTCRYPKVRTYGSWCLAAWELYLRQPHADRYATFQDDMVTYRNLRQYLEQCEMPEQGYWNLYTFRQNEKPIAGWYESNQLGKGAVGLVFSNEGLRKLLATQYLVDRPLNLTRGWKALDGGIVCAYKTIGWKEYVHNPSLVQHTGEVSSMGNRQHPTAPTFRGEEFDALDLLPTKPQPVPRDPTTFRIGLVGYNSDSPLGRRNEELASNTNTEVWLVKPDGARPIRAPHPDVDTIFCPRGAHPKLRHFLERVDVVVFCEAPCYNELVPLARELKKRVIAVVNTPEVSSSWAPFVDLFLCTTLDAYNTLKTNYPCEEFSWPSVWHTGADKEFNLLVRTGEHRVAVV